MRENFEEAKAQYASNAARQLKNDESRRKEEAYVKVVTKPGYVRIDPISTVRRLNGVFKLETARELMLPLGIRTIQAEEQARILYS